MKAQLLLLLWLVALLPLNAGAQTVGLDRMTDLWELPQQELGALAFGNSSYDRTGLNEDGFIAVFSRLYYEKGEHILFDSTGPGCIYRMWFTNLLFNPEIRFYLDNETVPAYKILNKKMFNNSRAPFLNPLSWNDIQSSGGWVSYVPICFERHLKIASKRPVFFYNFTALRYPEGVKVDSFTGNEDITEASAIYDPANTGTDPKETANVVYETQSLTISPGETAIFFDRQGQGQIASTELTPAAIDNEFLNNVKLQARFDSDSADAVNIALGMFFGATIQGNEVHALLFGIKGGSLYSFFPMPYFENAELSLFNDSTAPVQIDVKIGHTDIPAEDHSGTFEAVYQFAAPTTLGQDHVLAELTGQGKIIGVVQIAGGYSGLGYLEGDERFYPDGLRTPTIHGTGTEDYYNGGWYFNQGLFSLPTHGFVQHEIINGLEISGMYRLHPADTLNFSNGVRFSIEHDAFNLATNEVYSTCTFAYRIDEPALVKEAEFDVFNEDNQNRVNYKNSGDTDSLDCIFYYEGNEDTVPISDRGYYTTGWAEFTIPVNPFNDGVRLVRRIDQAQGRENVNVRVNDQDAGTWYTPDKNIYKRWRDTVFELPAELTKGKTSLTIKLENQDPDRHFSQYHYWFYSWKKPILSRMTQLELTSPSDEILVGKSIQLAVQGQYVSGNTEPVTGWVEFELSDNNLASVEYGLLEARNPGQLTVRAKHNTLSSNPITITIGAESDDDDNDDNDNDNTAPPDQNDTDDENEDSEDACSCE